MLNKLVLILFGCLLSIHGAVANSEPESLKAMEFEVLTQVNNYRAAHHLNPLIMKSDMSDEARQHSQDMAVHKMGFGHSAFSERIARIFKHAKNPQGGAENVAYNYKNAQHVVSNWLTSSGHKRNIQGHYNYTGIGIVRDSKGKLYFTQIFMRAEA